ncbi:MAG: type II toxin-antitoxin system VapC family toxin [Acidobacteria bacterium]|nr:type II toxin-antitoxin system VapC family toxin [Acidobacteriota bacterium]
MAIVVVDTDILIDVTRGNGDAAECLSLLEQQSNLAVSVVTEMELIAGCHDKAELLKIEKLLRPFQVIRISETISDRTVELLKQYRLSHGLLIPDALIAATALDYGVALISKNQRDFRFIAGLNLLPYP